MLEKYNRVRSLPAAVSGPSGPSVAATEPARPGKYIEPLKKDNGVRSLPATLYISSGSSVAAIELARPVERRL